MATQDPLLGLKYPPDIPGTLEHTEPQVAGQSSIKEPDCRREEHGASKHGETLSEHQKPDSTKSDAPESAPEKREPYPERLPPIFSIDGDTLVYIDPPPRPAPSDMAYPVTAVPHRIHSRTLLETGSAYFQKFFQPTYQFRIVKQRGLVGRLPDGVKYVISLTPPTVEDEAVVLIMELSCPLGVRLWASKRERWSLPPACVGGQDELESIEGDDGPQEKTAESENPDTAEKDNQRNSFPARKEETAEQVNTSDTAGSKSPKKVRLPVEYSASRHRRGIEQILHVLEGSEVTLDTPCKLWTFFALANIFEVATTPRICDRVLAWFYEGMNTRFIELHPEITYKVACGLKCSTLCRAAFSILVGEEALLLLAKTGKPIDLARPKRTFHGRLRDTLDDTALQRIEYASKSFMDYVVDRFIHLAGTEMPWLGELDEWQKVLCCPAKAERHDLIVSQLISTLKDLVRGHIYSRFCRILKPGILELVPYPPAIDDYDYPPESFTTPSKDTRYIERLMSRTFWNLVQREQFRGNWPFYCPDIPHSSIADLGDLPAFKDQGDARIVFAALGELREKVQAFNKLRALSSDPNNEPEPYLDLDELFRQIKTYVSRYASQMTEPPPSGEMPLELTDTLTCLTENEYKFLPLWAGGNDDGSGGVFEDLSIPIPESGGFSAPGPGINTGSTGPSDGSYSIIAKSEIENTAQGASHRATESHQTMEALSMASMISSLHVDVQGNGTSHDAALTSWQTEDNAPSPAPGDSDNELNLDASDDSHTLEGAKASRTFERQ